MRSRRAARLRIRSYLRRIGLRWAEGKLKTERSVDLVGARWTLIRPCSQDYAPDEAGCFGKASRLRGERKRPRTPEVGSDHRETMCLDGGGASLAPGVKRSRAFGVRSREALWRALEATWLRELSSP